MLKIRHLVILASLVLLLSACGGGGSRSPSPSWETVVRNQTSKLLNGFANKNINQIEQVLAPRVRLISGGEDTGEISKHLFLGILEEAFRDIDIRNFTHGTINVSRAGTFAVASVEVSYVALAAVHDTWVLTFEETGGTWLVRQWELGGGSVSSLGLGFDK